MKKIYSLFVALATTTVMSAQSVITQWNFDGNTNAATTGSGTASVFGVSNNPTFASGSPGRAWSVNGFPGQGSASGTAGFKFEVDTSGYSAISVSLNIAGSNTSSKYFQMQYTTNGTEWFDVGNVIEIGPTSSSNWVSMNNSIPAGANNKTQFAVRIVSVFDPANSSTYTAVGASSNYSTSGAARVDNVTISGTASTTLSVLDAGSEKFSFIKNTFIKNEGIVFGTKVKDIKIFNMYGQVIKTAKVSKNQTLDISELQKGNYIVTGIVNNQPVSQKILKD
ncbi:T9SS type A sorting domain-containing protein [Chryseobacterium sp. LAM-KRS1]|uniref:T9SS type A sorting domain-containing protein n=1 Tax=Chryseobacterium sp. LAM-KRS1 TaxID=2715754 RepID=UPI001555F9E9|nr:T9SS type A sorting domain-containing protein [Chryseobacterium sp. LAM-KRS1]